ncbi:mechanosensitive ion channel family protein [Thermosynechococcus sp. HN-54]|uniref:mechanosensitive ion channel family protein n=1 Tax=Thermosynechococcus sp. HN-54 TaxID=2933959 RepID=UPI00202D00EF|nr:mechanosensitive ion channel family protein [Thermosynechococcus sp. HN-54]URR35225.1 mechanosensitive ion channel family protein [Thermosynechococcus sp. HN-54]
MTKPHFWTRFFLCLLFAFLLVGGQARVPSMAQTAATPPPPPEIQEYPVTLDGEVLFEVRQGIGSFTPEERAAAIQHRILQVAEDEDIPVESITIKRVGDRENVSVVQGNRPLVTITRADVGDRLESQEEVAVELTQRIRAAISRYRQDRVPQTLLKNTILAILTTVLTLILCSVILRISAKVFPPVSRWGGERIPPLRLQNFEIISQETVEHWLLRIFQFTRLILLLFVLYLYLTFVFNLFPWTRTFGKNFLNHFLGSLEFILTSIGNYLPNLVAIALISAITYYILKGMRAIFSAIESERLLIPGFYTDWAKPTYNLLQILIIALAAVVVFPYLPGFDSPAFRGISVFLGILFSLGSTSAIANVVGGVILIYTRSFQQGDLIQIGDVQGIVVQKTLLVTRICRPNNQIVTIPNSSLLNSNVTNLSVAIRELDRPLILQTTITLGYDVPWREVYAAMIEAGRRTEGVLAEPSPFVWQTALNDFHISYQLNVYTRDWPRVPCIMSELHENLQDACNEAGIEIMSPSYLALRDGNTSTIPNNYLGDDYFPPGFRIILPK